MLRGLKTWLRVAAPMTLVLFAFRLAGAQTLVFNPGMVTSVAGNGTASYAPASYAGPEASAGLNFPRRIAIDPSGNLYWMEKGGQVARVLASGKGTIPALPGVASPTAGWVYTIAGNGATTSTCATKTNVYGDGCPAGQASLNAPYGLAVDAKGNVYLGDTGDNAIRVVYAAGTIPGLPAPAVVGNVYTVAGTGTPGVAGDGGPAVSAQISTSHGLAVDAGGNLYFADSGNQSVRAVYVSGSLPGIAHPVVGNLYTLAGGASAGVCAKSTSACGDGGTAIAAQINGPDSVSVDAFGNIYIGDTGDLRVRAIFAGGSLPGIANPLVGNIYTVAGNGATGSGPDGVQATASSLTSGMGQPYVDAAGDLYIPDGSSNTVRKVDPSGIITTVMGGAVTLCPAHADAVGDGCAANAVLLSAESGLVIDPAGDIFVADYKNNRIRLLTPGASTLNFSGAIGATIAQQTVTVANGGAQPLKLTGITASGPYTQASGGSADCSAATVLAPGSSCQIVVATTASQTGASSGSIVVESNALNGVSGANTVQLLSSTTLGTTSTAVRVSPALAGLGQTVSMTATVNVPAGVALSPTGTVTFYNGSTALGSASLAGGVATFTTTSLTAGIYSLTASYGGDTNFAASVSSAAALDVSATPDFALTSNLPSLTLYRGVTGHLTLSLTPVSNFTGSVTLSCGTLPAGVSCTFNPATLVADSSGKVVTGALEIDTNGAVSQLAVPGGRGVMTAALAWLPALFAGLALLLTRRRVAIRRVLVLLLMLGALGAASGCGAGKPYAAPSVTTLTITGTGGNVAHAVTVSLSVI